MLHGNILNESLLKAIYNLHKQSRKVVFDTREIVGGELFWALPGSRTHGDQFVEEALSKGAIGAISSNPRLAQQKVIIVEDTLKALQSYASWYRTKIRAKAVIGITGSSGKTTTRALTAYILSGLYKVSQPEKNYNNHIGVPITILNTPEDIDFLVLELGANHVGEIEFLCKIAQPTEGLITNIGRAHLEGFGSLEGVIKAKTELYKWIGSHGNTLYVNCDDHLLLSKSNEINANKVYYGARRGKVVGRILCSNPFLNIKFKKPFDVVVNTQLAGRYNLYNILAAASIGLNHSIPLRIIAKQIATFQPVRMRSNLVKINNKWFWFDAYNANPDSMLASLISFTEFAKENRLFIIGSMKELGNQSVQLHEKILNFLIMIKEDSDEIILIGNEWQELLINLRLNNIKWFESVQNKKFLDYIRQHADKQYIFIKGSRENKLELVVNQVEELFAR